MAASPLPATPETDDALVSSLIVLMEKGATPWRREWDSQHGGHHVNLFSGRPYRGANPILLTMGLHQRASSVPYWCGAAEAKAHGLHPRKGSKAVRVLRPQVMRRHTEPKEPNPSASPSLQPEVARADEHRSPRPWVRYVPVCLFNAEDLEGRELAERIASRKAAEQHARRPEPQRLARAEAVLQAWPVPMHHEGHRAAYHPREDRILLPERRAFHSSAAFYATWAHEAIHSTGHPARLGRDLSATMGSPTYAREELVAELGAVLLGDRLEIGSDVGNHAAYLAEWVQLLRESPRLLYRLLSEARRAVDLICTAEENRAD